MAIGPVVLNGMDMRTQDYSQIKHNEDNKAIVNQQNAQVSFEKNLDTSLTKIRGQEEMRRQEKGFDARQKGSNEYAGDGGRKRKKTGFDGKVTVKSQTGGFDFKV